MNQEKQPLEESKPKAKIAILNPKSEKRESHLARIEEASKILHTEEDHEETRCGIGFFKPKWLQQLARKEMYVLVYCLCGMTHGMFFTYTVSVLSTIEKRFRLTSKQTGTILSGNDISQVILSILLGYFGNYGHRPRWMSAGVMMAAISGFAAALPHFIYGPGDDAITISQLSKINSGIIDPLLNATGGFTPKAKKQELCFFQPDTDCGEGGDAGGAYVGPAIFFFISQFCVGITVSIFYSIGITYLDDNINKKTYPIYSAITFMLRILGPVCGYFVGGKCLSVWIDPDETPNLTRKDPRWYGAWWIGYLFIGSNLLFVGSLLRLFPKMLPATLRRESKRVVRQAERDAEDGSNRGVVYFASLAKQKKGEKEQPSFANLKRAMKRIFSNKIWVGNLFNTVVYVIAASGYWNFKPKYLENQFRKSTSESSYYTGVASLVSLVLGTGIGGAVLRWIQPSPRFVTGYNIFITLLQSTSYIVLMFVGCPKLNVIGPVEGSITPDCSAACGCSERFSPICSEDKTTLFYSPCYAGCTTADTTVSPIVYSGCRCITNSTNPFDMTNFDGFGGQDQENHLGYATSGYCDESCNTFIYYIVIQMVIKTIASTGRVGSSLIHIRSVEDEDKGLALGTLTVCLSLFGFIPAPIIMGAIVDSACLVWDKTCGKYGNCWLYDSDKFRIIIHLFPAIFITISVIGDIVVYYYSRQLDLYGDKDNVIDIEGHEEIKELSKPLNGEGGIKDDDDADDDNDADTKDGGGDDDVTDGDNKGKEDVDNGDDETESQKDSKEASSTVGES